MSEPTREQLATAGAALQRAASTLYGDDGSTVEQAAQAALYPGGPSYDELVARITARRNGTALADTA